MIRFDQIDVEDLDAIDPRIIQPLQTPQPFTYDDLNCDQESSSSVLNVSTPEDVLSPGTLDVEDVKMEQCINLELYMSPIIVSDLPTTIDELNTPIFDTCKEPDVTNNKNMQDTTFYPFEFPVQVKQDTLPAKPTALEQPKQQIIEQQQPDLILQQQQHEQPQQQQQQQENKNCRESNSSVIVTDDIYNQTAEQQQDEDDAFFIDLEEYDFLVDYQQELLEVMEPQDYALKLNVDSAVASTSSATLETPDVINTICSIEKDFNFFTFDGTIVQPEDILPDIQSSTCKPEPISPPESSNDSSIIPLPTPKQRRKRKLSEDDEDYVPPPPVKRKFKRRASTDSEEEYEPMPVKKRGRPSKTLSVSSENSEPSRYREMRDKNNEASRRSRHKRKVQEMTFEQEREELERTNVKLKAQVEELERTVAMRRNDLMTLMLNKS